MRKENPFLYPNKGGRPPHSHIKERVFDIVKDEFIKAKEEGLPAPFLTANDVLKMYRARWKKTPDLKTIKKYLQTLSDDKMLKAVLRTDNKAKNPKKRWRQFFYEYNLEM